MNNLLDRLTTNIRQISVTVFNNTIAPGQIVDPDSFNHQPETFKNLYDVLCLHVAYTTFDHYGYKDYANPTLKPIIDDYAARALHRMTLFKTFYDFDLECESYRQQALLQAKLILETAFKYLIAEDQSVDLKEEAGWFKRIIDKCI